jgi:hypothetical protein
MNNLKTEDVSALLELLKDSDFDELHVETDEFEVYVARRGAASRIGGRDRERYSGPGPLRSSGVTGGGTRSTHPAGAPRSQGRRCTDWNSH